MKRGLFIFLVCLIAVSAEDHYVTPDGQGTGTKSSPWGPDDFNDPGNWNTAANTNDRHIGPGDTVYFSGTFDIMLILQGSGTAQDYITLDGLEDGEVDMHWDTCPGCAKWSMEQLANRGQLGFYGEGKSYIIFQDFEFENVNHAISVREGSSYIWFKRNIVHDTLDDGFNIIDSTNIVVGGALGDGNHLYDCGTGTGAADVVTSNTDYMVVSYNWLEGGDNPCRGIDGVTLNSNSNNYLIEYNLIEYHNDEGCGLPEPYASHAQASDPDYMHGLRGPGEDATDVKKNCHNVVIRGNVMRGHHFQGGTHIHGRGYSVYVYGNYIADNGEGVIAFNNVNDFSDTIPAPHDIHIWANIFEGNYGGAIGFARSQEGGSNPREPYDLYVYNNVFFGNVIEDDPFDSGSVSSVTSAINWGAGRSSGRGDQNNIFYKNRIDETPYHHERFYYSDWKSFDEDPTCTHSHNTYFDPRGPSGIRWYNSDGTYVTKTIEWVRSNTELADQSYDEDPGMEDAEGGKYWPASAASQIVGSGTALSDDKLPGRMCFLEDESICIEMSYSTGLSPETDWTTNPPTVVWRTFDSDAWDRGPFVYSESACTPSWTCASWICDGCVDDSMSCSRTCTDSNSCQPDKTEHKTEDCQTPIDKQYIAKKGTAEIDGDISEFTGAFIFLENSHGNTAKYWFMWDDDNLYVAGDVKDTDIEAVLTEEDSNLWSDDSIEFIVDTLLNGGSKPQSDDYKFWISARGVKTDSKAYDKTWDSRMVFEVVMDGTLNDDAPDTGYVFEASIPLVAPVENNSVWGLNLVFNDGEDALWSGAAINNVDDAGTILFIDDLRCLDMMQLLAHINRWKQGHMEIGDVARWIHRWRYCQ